MVTDSRHIPYEWNNIYYRLIPDQSTSESELLGQAQGRCRDVDEEAADLWHQGSAADHRRWFSTRGQSGRIHLGDRGWKTAVDQPGEGKWCE